jgi:hypothetical protein
VRFGVGLLYEEPSDPTDPEPLFMSKGFPVSSKFNGGTDGDVGS